MTPTRPRILTLRNWLNGSWIVAHEQEAAFKAPGIASLGRSNLENYNQIAFTWSNLGIRQTTSGESVPALTARAELLQWQNDDLSSGERGAMKKEAMLSKPPSSSFLAEPPSWSFA